MPSLSPGVTWSEGHSDEALGDHDVAVEHLDASKGPPWCLVSSKFTGELGSGLKFSAPGQTNTRKLLQLP